MRCEKCGMTSWDHLTTCKTCGADLTQIKASLGDFIQPEPDFSWFEELDHKERGNEEKGLLTTSDQEIGLEELEEVIEDDMLQKALEKVTD